MNHMTTAVIVVYMAIECFSSYQLYPLHLQCIYLIGGLKYEDYYGNKEPLLYLTFRARLCKASVNLGQKTFEWHVQ